MKQLAEQLWPQSARELLLRELSGAAGLPRVERPSPFVLSYDDLAPSLSSAARRQVPAVFIINEGKKASASSRLLAVVAYSKRRATVLCPDGEQRCYSEQAVAELLRASFERAAAPELDQLTALVTLTGRREAKFRVAMLSNAEDASSVTAGWALRPAALSLAGALRQSGALRRAVIAACAHLVQVLLLLTVCWMISERALGQKHYGPAYWSFVLAAMVVARLIAAQQSGRLVVDAGEVLRSRSLRGLLALDPVPMRSEGVGRLLGRAMDVQVLEALALHGGLQAITGAIELLFGVLLVAIGEARYPELAFLLGWTAIAAWLAKRLYTSVQRWSQARLDLSHDLIETMAGHRTLVAQLPYELRHCDEDQAIDGYEIIGRTFDRDLALMSVMLPRGWLLVGLAGLGLHVVAAPDGAGFAPVATSIAGVLCIYGALSRLASAVPALALASVAWRQCSALLESTQGWALASLSAAPAGEGQLGADPPVTINDKAGVVARNLRFRYPGRGRDVVSDISLEIKPGDRLLVEGPSGGGKSTVASLLAGLHQPTGGELLLHGKSWEQWDTASWRSHVGSVVQFHENHVFSASLLFNLLVGRTWPPNISDIEAAKEVCHELGLGDLLERMPLGIAQMVGDSGWQLSHGERSRLFIARSLLQKLDIRIFDESFAALDPQTLEQTLSCVLRRSETLVVIAHP